MYRTHISVCRDTNTDHDTSNRPHPCRRIGVFSGEQSSTPDMVDDGERANGVCSIVRSMGKGVCTGGKDL